MKLSKRNMVTVSFMLFSLFFGAGNLIFPPFLGQNAGSHTLPAILGFLATAVVLLGLSHGLWKNNRYVYPFVIGATACVSVVYALDAAGLSLGFVGDLCRKLPLCFCWVSVALAALTVSLAAGLVRKK